MAWIETIDEAEADDELAALYASMLDRRSQRVDHVLKIHGLSPPGLEGHFGLYQAVMRGTRTLRKVEREMIAFTVSRLNHCHY